MNDKQHTDIIKAIEMWVDITGVDPNASSFKYGDWDIRSMNEELKESMKLDDSGVLSVLMMDYFMDCYLKNRSIDLFDLVDQFDNDHYEFVNKVRELRMLMRSKEMQEIRDDYKRKAIMMVRHYDADREDVMELIDDPHELVFLWRDALKAIEELQVHQFYQGEPSKDSPAYVKGINEFWNINSLLKIMSGTKSGVSLNLIRDALNTSSYFAFAVRNGGTLTVLTDKPRQPHPFSKYKSRGKAAIRDFKRRVFNYHFPYDLLEYKISEDEKAIWFDENNSMALVAYKDEYTVRKNISELEPDQVIWIAMMLSAIVDKFWKKGFAVKQLSYTAETIHYKNALVEAPQVKAIVDTKKYKKIELELLNKDDITAEKLKAEWERKPTFKNKWIEDRYADRVDEQIMNLVEVPDGTKMLPERVDENNINLMPVKEQIKKLNLWQRKEMPDLASINPVEFGTQEELRHYQKWVARYNQAAQIKDMVEQEYQERKGEVQKWYNDAILKNMDKLLEAVAKRMFVTHRIIEASGFKIKTMDELQEDKIETNILEFKFFEDSHYRNDYCYGYNCLGRRYICFHKKKERSSNYGCYINGKNALITALFKPNCSESLADMCGCKVNDLPDVLQNWTSMHIYSGNDILSDIDPMEWIFENPWVELDTNVKIFISKSGWVQNCKRFGVSVDKFWERMYYAEPRAERGKDYRGVYKTEIYNHALCYKLNMDGTERIG